MHKNVRGMTLLEMLLAMTVIGVALMSLMYAMAEGMREDQVTQENILAMNAARQVLETMRSTDTFSEVFSRYNEDADDDPDGIGTATGCNFSVEGLTDDDDDNGDDTEQKAGRIEFPQDTSGALREDVDDDEMGMPRDLDGLNGVDSSDHSTDYALLPVRIVIEWESPRGPHSFSMVTFLAPK